MTLLPARPTFRGLSALRGARIFHPDGRHVRGTLTIEGADGPLPQGESEVLARVSKAVGTPSGVPDFLGLALRIGPDSATPVEVLLASTLTTVGPGRWAIFPVRRWAGARFTSLMPYASGNRLRQVVAQVAGAATSPEPEDLLAAVPVTLEVATVDLLGRPRQHGRLLLELPVMMQEPTAFDPVLRHPVGWELAPRWLARIRADSYEGSREGRNDR